MIKSFKKQTHCTLVGSALIKYITKLFLCSNSIVVKRQGEMNV